MRILSLFLGIVFLIGVTYATSCSSTTTSWTSTIVPVFHSFKLENKGKYVIETKYETSTSGQVEVAVEVCNGKDTANAVFSLENNKAGYVHLLVDTVIPTTTTVAPTVLTTTSVPSQPPLTIDPNSAARTNPLSSLFVMLIPLFFVNRRLSVILAVLVALFSLQVSHAETATTQITITIRLPAEMTQRCVDDYCETTHTGAEYYLGSRKYTAIDNASPYSGSVDECSSSYFTLPSGWDFASTAELEALAATGAWPTTTCLIGATDSVDQAGGSCSAKSDPKTVGNGTYYGTSKCGRIILSAALPSKLQNFNIGMKIVVISIGVYVNDTVSDAGLVLANTMLRALGVPFDMVPLMDNTKQDPTFNYDHDLPLFDEETGVPKYYGIVTTGELVYNKGGSYESILTTAQQTQLKLYKRLFSVREVILNTSPVGAGMTVSTSGNAADKTALAIDATWAAANPSLTAGINYSTARFDLNKEFYRAVTVAGSASDVTPIARFVDATGTVTSFALGAIVKDASEQTESMQFFVGNSIYLTHGPVLSNIWVNWLTRGVWMGIRRISLSPQIDDLFLSTDRYGTKEGTVVDRMTGTDLGKVVTFLPTLNAKVPGSNITLEFGYNGFPENESPTELMAAVQTHNDEFFWESHTWTHLDLTCPESDCVKYGTTTYDDAYDELKKNIDFTADTLFKNHGGLDNPYYSPDCMITPKISGLLNKNALKALVDNKITCVVGDNSVVALKQDNPYRGEWTTKEKHGYEGVFIIPRFATEIYYDTSTPTVATREFNDRYGLYGSIASLGKNYTMEEIMDREAGITLRWLSQYRHDPYMFHQGNIIHNSYSAAGRSGQWSLVTLWLDHLVELYAKTFSFPIKTVPHKYLRDAYMARRERDDCEITATMTIAGGAKTSVNLSSKNSCEAAVTGLTKCNAGDKNCRVEPYGPDSTVWSKISKSTSATLETSGSW